jgi:formate/nitrite transporter FocA (FNT family)
MSRARAEHRRPTESDLSPAERKRAEDHTALNAAVVHEAVLREGAEQLLRPSASLAFSGLAAGLSMGFSLIAVGLLHAHLPDEPWRPLLSSFGYTVGFLVVVLGRQQLFTEDTLTVVLPLLSRRDARTLLDILRLWAIVLVANLLGALALARVVGNTAVFDPGIHEAFAAIGHEALMGGFGTILLRGIFAGWLIALMVWLLPFAETARFFVVVIITYLVKLGGFAHIIAGSVEVLYLVTTGAASWGMYLGGFMLPTLLGNILGGVVLVAMLNQAQVGFRRQRTARRAQGSGR